MSYHPRDHLGTISGPLRRNKFFYRTTIIFCRYYSCSYKKALWQSPQGYDEKVYILKDCLSNIIGSAGEYLSNNAYKSKLFSSNKNWRKPSIKIPSSLRRGRISSFTTIIFLNESGIARKGRSSCLTFSSDGKAYAD